MINLIERLRDASLEDAAIHEGYTHILHEAAAPFPRRKLMWTEENESELQAMLARKADATDPARVALTALCARVGSPLFGLTPRDLITHADEFRDALLPFDSGVRSA